jgi:hypothetical protein
MSAAPTFPRSAIERIINDALNSKLKTYEPESKGKPFLEAVISKEKVVTHSVVHSILTSFGMSFYEQVAIEIAHSYGAVAEHQYKLDGFIPDEVFTHIRRVMQDLRSKPSKRAPNRAAEIDEIRALYPVEMAPLNYPDNTVDVRLVLPSGKEYLFDITTATPNIKEFAALKEKTLLWTALRISQSQNADVIAAIGIPYNPYAPQPYNRWTVQGIYESGTDLLVADEMWNTIGQSERTYSDLMNTLEALGEKWRPILDEFIKGVSER